MSFEGLGPDWTSWHKAHNFPNRMIDPIGYIKQLEWCINQLKRKEIWPATILDVGLGWGISANLWLDTTEARVVSVDIKEGGLGADTECLQLNPRWSFVQGDAARIIPSLPESFDFAFLDTSHEYDATWNELRAIWPKIKPGGILAGHDCMTKMAVLKALLEFCKAHRCHVEINSEDHIAGVFVIHKPSLLP